MLQMNRFEKLISASGLFIHWTITIIATVGECVIIVTSGIKIACFPRLEGRGKGRRWDFEFNSLTSLSEYASWLFFPCFYSVHTYLFVHPRIPGFLPGLCLSVWFSPLESLILSACSFYLPTLASLDDPRHYWQAGYL